MSVGDDNNKDEGAKSFCVSREPKHTAVVSALLGMIGIMTVVVIYSPELYNLFCKVTGYGGTVQRAEAGSGVILDKKITVKFDATVAKGFNWEFKPVQKSIDVHIGETVVVIYRAKNFGKEPLVGTAIYNVTPEIAGVFLIRLNVFVLRSKSLSLVKRLKCQ